MKNNFFGYMFILFIIIIMGFAIYRVKIQNSDKKQNDGSSSIGVTQEIKKGTEMTLAISEFDTINPIITSNKKVQDIDKLIYEPLINITEDYKTEYALALESIQLPSHRILCPSIRQPSRLSSPNNKWRARCL